MILSQDQYRTLVRIKDHPLMRGWSDLSQFESGCSPLELDQLHAFGLLCNHPGERWRIDGCEIATAVTKPTALADHILTSGQVTALDDGRVQLETVSGDWYERLEL